MRSKSTLVISSLACVVLGEPGSYSPRALRVLHEKVLRRPRWERQRTPILLGRLALARCFPEVLLAAPTPPAAGIFSPAASYVSFRMPLGPYRRDSEERATRPHGTRFACQWRWAYRRSEVDGTLRQGCSGLGRTTRRFAGRSVPVPLLAQIGLDRHLHRQGLRVLCAICARV